MMDELEAIALAAAAKKRRATGASVDSPPQRGPEGPGFTDYVAQAGAGSQQGIAQMAGFPVDAVASGISGLGQMTGLWGPIENPIGGSKSIDRLISPIRKNVPEPDTAGLRVARRLGEEIGASAVAAPVALASPAVRAAPGTFAATEAGSALGAGTAAGVAGEVAPDSGTAEIVAALSGGLAGGRLGARLSGGGATAATVRGGIDEQRAIANDAYGRVRADQTIIPQNQLDDLSNAVQSRTAARRINPRLHPGASNVQGAIVDDIAGGNVRRVEDLEDLRRVTTRSMPVNAAPDDRALAEIMKSELTNQIDNLGGQAAENLRIGRDAHRRASAASEVKNAFTKATRRAATTGSGGNEINAVRQNLRKIIENPRLSRSFSKAELEIMDRVAKGEGGANLLRRLSRFSPSSGGLSAMLGIGGVASVPEAAIPAIIVSEIAKMAGEKVTRGGVADLLKSIAPDRVLKPGSPGVEAITRALLSARTTASGLQDDMRTTR